jgi:hypothetical protein
MTSPASSLYRIRIEGSLEPAWSDRLGGLAIEADASGDPGSVTTLAGALVDQSALSGVLNTLVDLHLRILSVECLSAESDLPHPRKGE